MVTRARSGVSGVVPGSPHARTHSDTSRGYATRATRKPKRVADQDFHLWPVTGLTCRACGMPLDSALRSVGTHPTCEPDHNPPRQRTTKET